MTIEELLEKCEKLGLTENDTIEKLMDKFNISDSDAKKYIKKYVKKLLK